MEIEEKIAKYLYELVTTSQWENLAADRKAVYIEKAKDALRAIAGI